MTLLEHIYKKVLAEAKASENKINLAIDRHSLVMIRYNTHGEHVAMANRLCGVFAYGTTKRGNPCIRVFEYEGDTTTFVPGWKLIRLDRIINWYDTKRTFSQPPQLFNPEGDNSMSMVYKVAKFEGLPSMNVPQGTKPTTASAVKTGTSKQQAQKQATDAKKVQQGLKPFTQSQETEPTNTPKTAQDVKGTKERVGLGTKYADKPIMKTDTENAMEYLRKQLDNPEKIDLSKFNRKQPQHNTTPYNTTQNIKQANPTVQQPIQGQGLGQQYINKPIRKTDTENAMDYLRRQLENPEK